MKIAKPEGVSNSSRMIPLWPNLSAANIEGKQTKPSRIARENVRTKIAHSDIKHEVSHRLGDHCIPLGCANPKK